MAGNKYGEKKVKAPDGQIFDSQIFDSQKEYHRWCVLKLLERAGKISGLKRQVSFELIPKQDGERACKYVADFVYCDADGNTVIEDTKGCKKGAAYDVFAIKRKLFLYRYGIKIKET